MSKIHIKSSSNNKLSFQRKARFWLIHTSTISKLLSIVILYFFFFTSHLNFIKEYVWENFYEIASEAGFKLETVIIKGNTHIEPKEIVATLNADVGTPLFSVSLKNSYNKLKENSWIKNLSVMRRLPNTIVIHITERTPIAIWQNEKKLALIDFEGNIIDTSHIEDFPNLLQVVGSDANLYAENLIDRIGAEPELVGNIVSAVRYGERRWNLILKQNITVKMPEHDFDKALNYLAKMNNNGKLFDQNYKALDLRDPSKYYIEKM